MNVDLTETSSSKINTALLDARRRMGSPATGMVLTLLIVTEERDHYDALRAALQAAREHPSRILVVIRRPGRGEPRLDAEVRVGADTGPGEVLLLRMHGQLADHADSVVLPLLLPDAPVVAWWPGEAPEAPAEDPVGALAQRRVTDAAAVSDPLAALAARANSYVPGDTDLSWARLTTWRTLLSSALDEPHDGVDAVTVEAESGSPSAKLLALWLGARLGVDVEERVSAGPGITEVRLRSGETEIAISRPDGRLAVLTRPGQPDRPVALHRRPTAELIAEEMRWLDPDDMYGEVVALVGRTSRPGRRRAAEGRTGAAQAGGSRPATSKPAGSKSSATKSASSTSAASKSAASKSGTKPSS